MSRLTITLSEARYRALNEASTQRAKTIGQLIEKLRASQRREKTANDRL